MAIRDLFGKSSITVGQIWLLSFSCLGQIILLAGSGSLLAQDLNLFEEIEVNEVTNRRDRGRSLDNGDSAAGPEFTLIGTSRFGDNYSVFLRDREGDTIVVNSISGSNAFIPGHPSYELVEVNAARVSVRYPEEEPCVEVLERGIRCSAPDVAILTLANADPLESQLNITMEPDISESQGESQDENQEGSPVNPFAALLEQNANTNSNETNDFVPRRIRAEDVPPGMRVVSTPFGDRLVEE